MCGPILIFLIVLPIAEIMLLVQVGDRIGYFNTIIVALLTAVTGLNFVRRQGFSVLDRLRRGGLPRDSDMLDAPLLAAGALALLLPGFITDGIGILLLIPPLRRWLANGLIRRFPQHGNGNPNQSSIIIIRRDDEP